MYHTNADKLFRIPSQQSGDSTVAAVKELISPDTLKQSICMAPHWEMWIDKWHHPPGLEKWHHYSLRCSTRVQEVVPSTWISV